jgi:hypothetical protein
MRRRSSRAPTPTFKPPHPHPLTPSPSPPHPRPHPRPHPHLHPHQVLPGDYANSRSFQASLRVARRARRKYVLFNDIRLTGHSRGGSMADYVGRELGLPSLQINPGSWGKLFREEQVAMALHHPRLIPRPSPPSPFTLALHPRPRSPSPSPHLLPPPSPRPHHPTSRPHPHQPAVESLTARTADIISILEVQSKYVLSNVPPASCPVCNPHPHSHPDPTLTPTRLWLRRCCPRRTAVSSSSGRTSCQVHMRCASLAQCARWRCCSDCFSSSRPPRPCAPRASPA